jgi:hypothetical protein
MGGALLAGAAGLAVLAFASAWGAYVLAFGLAGFGLGITWSYTSVGTQQVVPEAEAGGASGITLAIVVGLGGLAVAVGATVLEALVDSGSSTTAGIHWLFAGLTALAVAAAAALALTARSARRVPA